MILNLKIRPLEREDRGEIQRILESTPEFTAEEVRVALDLIDIYLEQGVRSGYFHLVSQMESSSAGYICYGPTPMTDGTWDVYWIAVSSDRQRHGIGRALLQFAEEEIRKTGGRLILIETSSKTDYEKTRKFYDSMKYVTIARVPDFYTVGDDKLILGKSVKN